MLTSSRRHSFATRYAGRNRLSLAASAALEQAGGMLVTPAVIVGVCSLLTADLSAMILPAVAATVAWILGYAAMPTLLARVSRRLPWTIGASIVRAASLALLAYVLAGDGVAREQRLRSILICLTAYALAAGLARGATESLVPRATTARRSRPTDQVLTVLPAAVALAVGLGSFSLLIDVPRSPLPRLSALFAVAAALSGAAILFLARVVESPAAVAERRPRAQSGGWRRQSGALVWMTVTATSGAAELLLIVGLIRHVDLPRANLLSGLGVFLAASAVGAVISGWVERAVPFKAVIHMSAALSGIAFALGIGLPTLLETSQSPDDLLGRRPAEVGVWAAMALIGIAQQARRRVLPRLAEHTATSHTVINVAGFALAFLPLLIAVVFERWEPRDWLISGLATALLGIAVGGFISPRRANARPAQTVAVPVPSSGGIRPLGTRYSR